ncbi:MAG TPA: hypothetical protein VGD87_11900 [Archangium sp.]
MRTWGFLAALAVAAGLGALLQLVPSRPEAPADVGFAQRLQRQARVILITLDGPVRGDVFDAEKFPSLHAAVEAEGVLLPAVTASVLAGSLVGYQALYAGALTSCRSNDCGRVGVETLAEGLARELGLAPEDVAVFSSWALLDRAVSAEDGRVFLDAPDAGPITEDGPPWRNARLDDETFTRARAAWTAHPPRFLHLAFLDTDEWAHLGDRTNYERALLETDARIEEVLSWVRALPPEDAALTTVLITADHGRSRRDWTRHGFFQRGSRDIFIAAIGPLVAGGTQRKIDQTDVRPTIERLFGLCPGERRGEGRPIGPVVGELPCLP